MEEKDLTTRFTKFIGGKNILFSLIILLLVGSTIFIFNQVSFVFKPLVIILTTIAPPVVLAFIAFYLLNPIVNLLEKIRIKRLWGIITIILVIIGLITGLILIIAPHIENQINELTENLPIYIQEMSAGIKSFVDGSFLGSYYDEAYDWATKKVSSIPSNIQNYLSGAASGLVDVATTVTRIVIALVTFPFILFFLLKDRNNFKTYFLKLLPPKFREDANQILNDMDTKVGSYIQGQIIVATCIGILLFIGYLIIGLDYAITLAIIAAVTSVVPYLGPTIAVSPAIIISIVDSPFMLLKLAIVWAAVQFLEGHFISPNVMGKTMQIHPLSIMLVLLVAGNLFGIVGVILGIPGYALVKVLVTYVYRKFKIRYNRFYHNDSGYYEEL